MKSYEVLTPSQIEQFIEEGLVIVRGVTPRDVGLRIQKQLWAKLSPKPDDPSTWTERIVHLQESLKGPDVDAAYTARYVGAVNDLVGKDRWTLQKLLGWWPVTFPGFWEKPWKPPTGGWHVDGNFFHHHLNSREQGLLAIHLFSDIGPGDGGTAIILGSHLHAARVLAEHEPEGLDASKICQLLQPYAAENHHRAIEVQGEIGDVALMHPFMLHAFSPNTGTRPRIICNPCQSLNEPMNLRRQNPYDYSPVESAIIRGAGDLLEKATVGTVL